MHGAAGFVVMDRQNYTHDLSRRGEEEALPLSFASHMFLILKTI
jgi:hypothetical protein